MSTYPNNTAVSEMILGALPGRTSARTASRIMSILNQSYPSRRPATASKIAFSRNGDPSTSSQAAASVNATQAEGDVLQVLLMAAKPLNTHQIADLSGRAYGSITPRMKPLEGKGLISYSEVSGMGRKCRPYTLTEEGKRYTKKLLKGATS
jgi:DNA-binding MarR family transcriptional regulator